MKDNQITMAALSAPKLWLRRTAAIYALPWSQQIYATLMYLYGGMIGIPLRLLGAYWLTIFLICILIDLTAPQSRIIRLLCFLQSALKRLFPQYSFASPYVPQDQHQVFFTCRKPPLFQFRHIIHWVGFLGAILAAWGFAWLQAIVTPVVPTESQIIFTFFLFFGGLLPFTSFTATKTPFMSPPTRRTIWIILGIIGLLIALYTLKPVTTNHTLIAFGIACFFLVYIVILIIQRLWTGQKIWGEVIRTISMDCLNWPNASPNLNQVPALIGGRMRFDRVFILELTPDEQFLEVTAEHGDYTSVCGQKIPIANSLTGHAYQSKDTVIWNNIAACNYYHSVFNDDDTKAEMAVPIIHQGVVYGILDVQASVKGAYTPGDQNALETIAGILGTAIAIDKREQFFHAATALWRHVMSTNTNLDSEKDVFNLFAQFAQKRLGVDLVIYYPLSLAGYPVHAPYIYGDLQNSAPLPPPDRDPDSPLLQQISDWESFFDPHVTPNSQLAPPFTAGSSGFVQQEIIKSACFLPVGVRQERMGALFLYFRHEKQFDQAYKFSVLSLSQSLALAAAQVRYRDLVYKSFARPEMSIHSIIGRYGFKTSISAPLKSKQARQSAFPIDLLLTQMDQFIIELRLADSAYPPDFARQSFLDQIQAFKSSLPVNKDGRRPRLKLAIDPNIEKEFTLVKLALYRLITESITNAIIHGSASRIQVQLQRNCHIIEVEINNNGHPLPPEAEKRQSENGIYTLLRECVAKLGANTRIANLPQQKGVIVYAAIHALPPHTTHDDI
ncbi:MAG: GAF domain-containing protein [Chloroflexi bacterium]|nr:GAF domain-containing protein [Chloroflexota bacterium]